MATELSKADYCAGKEAESRGRHGTSFNRVEARSTAGARQERARGITRDNGFIEDERL